MCHLALSRPAESTGMNMMTTVRFLCIASTSLAMFSTARGESAIRVTSDVPGHEVRGELPSGAIVPITLFVESSCESSVLGLNLDLSCDGQALRIHSIAFNPAFSAVLGGGEPILPAARFRTARVQQITRIDRRLGRMGGRIWFARVDLEVLLASPFESALAVTARGALLAAADVETEIFGGESSSAGTAHGRIAIVNTSAVLDSNEGDLPGTPDASSPICDEAELVIEVRHITGATGLSVLAPHTSYQLHYSGGQEPINSYALFAVAASHNQGIAGAAPASSGSWSGTNVFAFVHLEDEFEEPFIPEVEGVGYLRYQLIMDEIWPHIEGASREGHLCDFTTSDEGQLALELYMDRIDQERQSCVAMRASSWFTVQAENEPDNPDRQDEPVDRP